MRFLEALARLPLAQTFAFTPDGRHVARIVRRIGGGTVEASCLDHSQSFQRVYGPDPRLDESTQLTHPTPDCIRVCFRQAGGFRFVEAHRSASEETSGGWTAEPIAECEAAALGMLPRLEGADWDLVISWADWTSTIWRLGSDRPRLQLLTQVPGILTGGTWLDPGRTLAVNLNQPGGRASGYVVDLATQTYYRLFHVSEHSDDHIVLCDPHRERLGVITDGFGYRRAGVVDLKSGERKVRFFPDPPGEERSVTIRARTVGDGRFVLGRQRGVAGELWMTDPTDLTLSRPLRIPQGVVDHPLICTKDRIRFPFSAPTIPPLCASYLLDQHRFLLDEAPDIGEIDPDDLVEPGLVSFRGPRGQIEALVYEPRPSRRRQIVVVALHGGPVEQWSAEFTPELQLFAGLGCLVVAPNYHGSTGYGAEFVQALQGRAGSVDLDDVVAITTAVRAEQGQDRTTVVLYGHSYGAFLALLAAAGHPALCEGVVAVAPFSSLTGMRATGNPSVQRLVDELCGPRPADEHCDVLREPSPLRARLLIAHGENDDLVPIEQSRTLCERLRAQGYQDGRDLWFLPLSGEGHVIMSHGETLRLYEQIASFLNEIENQSERRESTTKTRSRIWQAGDPLLCASELDSYATPKEKEVIM